MVTYPLTSLPLSGFEETPASYGSNVQRFVVPYSQSWPTTTKGARKFSIRHSLVRPAQVEAFRTFWEQYAAAGSFQLTHPRTGSAITCVVQAGNEPSIRRVGAQTWEITCEIEEAL